MNGGYIDDMVNALEEEGFTNVRPADRSIWSNGMLFDAAGTIYERNRDEEQSDFSNFESEGEQFNLVGYSHGAQQAAQAAADYADNDGKVDNLVLIGAPISQRFLDELNDHPNIENVIVKDLTEHGDPIRAGMTAGEQILAVPSLSIEYSGQTNGAGSGHFYYSGNNAESTQRRRDLAKWLKKQGLK